MDSAIKSLGRDQVTHVECMCLKNAPQKIPKITQLLRAVLACHSVISSDFQVINAVLLCSTDWLVIGIFLSFNCLAGNTYAPFLSNTSSGGHDQRNGARQVSVFGSVKHWADWSACESFGCGTDVSSKECRTVVQDYVAGAACNFLPHAFFIPRKSLMGNFEWLICRGTKSVSKWHRQLLLKVEVQDLKLASQKAAVPSARILTCPGWVALSDSKQHWPACQANIFDTEFCFPTWVLDTPSTSPPEY